MLRKLALLLIVIAMIMVPSLHNQQQADVEAQGDIVFVGSKSFTEAEILSWIVFLILEDEGIRVVDQMQTAPSTGEVRQALLDGDIDVYVEYTATGVLLLAEDNDDVDPESAYDATTAFTTVSLFDSANNDLQWLQPASANNTYALAVTTEFSEENEIETLEDLALYINTGNEVMIAGNTEFFERDDAYPSFTSTYEWETEDDQIYDMGSDAQPTQTLTALDTGENDTNVAMAYTTDGELLVGDFVVLEDTLGAQPYYAPAPVFRGEIIRNNPQIVARLQRVFQELDNRTLQNLNVSVTRFGDTPREAATSFLVEIGELDTDTGLCEVTRPADTADNGILRAQPSTDSQRRSTMPPGTTLTADGKYEADDGFIWYRLVLGPWVREDVVELQEDCQLGDVELD